MLVSAAYVAHESSETQQQRVYAKVSEDRVARVLEPPVVWLFPPKYRPEPAYEDYDTEQYDLVAQRWMAWLTGLLTAFTGIGIILLWLTMRDTRRILHSTEGATAAAHSAAAAAWKTEETTRYSAMQATRPWVKIEPEPSGKLTVDGNLGYIPLIVTLKNFGERPALEVQMHWFFIQKGAFNPHEETDAALSTMVEQIPSHEIMTLYPGDNVLDAAEYCIEIDPAKELKNGALIFGVLYKAPGWEADVFHTIEMYLLNFVDEKYEPDGFRLRRLKSAQRIT